MTNVIFPLISFYLSVGRTINIRNYHRGLGLPIYNETDVVENPLNLFNASYYVLPDENIPGDKLRVPIDLLLQAETEGNMSAKRHMIRGYSWLSAKNTDNALILVVAEYQTSEQTTKANTKPTPGWQDNIWTHSQTHYSEKVVYGYQVMSFVSVRSLIKGDIQVFRRILRDTMGASGTVTADTVELWKKAERALRESPDIRGKVYMDADTDLGMRHSVSSGGIEDMFRHVSEFQKNVEISPDDYVKTPLYVRCKLLHDIDPEYPILRKDVESEEYFVKFFKLLRDIEAANSELSNDLRYLSRENKKKLKDFTKTLRRVHTAFLRVMDNNLSLYEYVDKKAIQRAFEKYQQGLDNTTESYVAQFRKLREKIATGIKCGEDFYPPTRGALRVADDEVFQKGKVLDFEICKYLCVEDELCRAVGYSENECLIYYRSTVSATIIMRGDSEDMKIYDRKCRFRYDDKNY